jgi:hypothetical protein
MSKIPPRVRHHQIRSDADCYVINRKLLCSRLWANRPRGEEFYSYPLSLLPWMGHQPPPFPCVSIEPNPVHTWRLVLIIHFYPEDGSSKCLRNVGNTAQIHMVRELNSRITINRESPWKANSVNAPMRLITTYSFSLERFFHMVHTVRSKKGKWIHGFEQCSWSALRNNRIVCGINEHNNHHHQRHQHQGDRQTHRQRILVTNFRSRR